LNGIWLRGPYRHNGSVPTLRGLLQEPAERPRQFCRGNDLYNWTDVGFESKLQKEKDGNLGCGKWFRYESFKTEGEITEDGGSLAVKTSDGSIYRLHPKPSTLHRHAMPTAGDQVTIVLDRKNLVTEIHPKDEGGEQVSGNGNGGHLFGTNLNDAEKDELLEYLKTL